MHQEEREQVILALVGKTGFASFKQIDASVAASPATLRRDLGRLEEAGMLSRVRGGARSMERTASGHADSLVGVPFHENVDRHPTAKAAIGHAAAALCNPGESIMIDGGSTTLQMCRHLAGLNLQVLTNSLHVVSALLVHSDTRIAVPGGSVFREQNIILGMAGEECMPRIHAPKLFMGAALVGAGGVMQADVVIAAAERQMIDRAEWVALLVDSSKFAAPSGTVVCNLEELDVIVTDSGIEDARAAMIERAGVKLIIT